MSLLGAMNTAISGLSSQSAAFGNIADNGRQQPDRWLQAGGYQLRGLPDHQQRRHERPRSGRGATGLPRQQRARHRHANRQSARPGDRRAGLLPQCRSRRSGQQYSNLQSTAVLYARRRTSGSNAAGYLANSAGEFLNGWSVNPNTGVVNQNALVPIQVTQTVYNPVATANVTLSANLPATPAARFGRRRRADILGHRRGMTRWERSTS